jgi:nickel/cobalt exporter
MTSRRCVRLVQAALGVTLAIIAHLVSPPPVAAHPMGNFSISHYTGIRIERDGIRLHFLLDLAEIPTFQEIQEARIVPEIDHPSLAEYLTRKTEAVADRLRLEVNGRRLPLRREVSEIIFPPGAGGLPTLKLGVVYRAPLDEDSGGGVSELRYEDANFPDRAGWKEVVAVGGPGVTLVSSSVPEHDRSRELTDYPTDLLESPPQDVQARILFTQGSVPATVARTESRQPPVVPSGPNTATERPLAPRPTPSSRMAAPPATADSVSVEAPGRAGPLRLQANQQSTPRSAFTELIAAPRLGLGVILFALVVAASLGAFHALEPGHGKTVVAAYLIGSRGTAWHALVLGLIVTASHTAGVYLLGAVTLYASRYVVPERLYPWLGVISGFTIAVLGLALFLRRYASASHAHHHDHGHDADHAGGDQSHHHHHHHAHGHHGGHRPDGPVSLRALVALGVTGGIVPCPAALVVLLSAVALRRVGFGLVLIMAFSVGLAAVLIGIGLLMVYAGRFMSRFQGEGRLITRWLPLTSAAVIALSGVGIAAQALASAGILQLRL